MIHLSKLKQQSINIEIFQNKCELKLPYSMFHRLDFTNILIRLKT